MTIYLRLDTLIAAYGCSLPANKHVCIMDYRDGEWRDINQGCRKQGVRGAAAPLGL